MKKNLYCCMALLSMTFWACFTPDKPGSGLYFFVPAPDNITTKSDSLMSPVSFLELRSDGSYTQDFGHFDYGSWMLKDKRLYLTNQRHRTYVYLMGTLTAKKMILVLDGGRFGHFNVHPMPSGSAAKDPFSTGNNQWRIPATHKESDAEIKKRLFNMSQFWEAYLSWAHDRDEGDIDTKDIPSPLNVYGNGFGLKHFTRLPTEWKSYFYDTLDLHKADTMIKHTFRRHDFVWPDTKDDMKKLISGTQQLQQWLK